MENDRLLGQEEKFCRECGAAISPRAEICPKCRVRQLPPPDFAGTAPNGKSKLAAALFAFFLGGFGIHKFYLGQVVWGLVYLFLFWTFLPALLGFIEGILYLVMSDAEFARKYGQN